jgi:hypothetical protein
MTTKNSTLVSNFEASPQTMNAAHQLHGVKRIAQGSIALATGDLDLNDLVMLAPIPSNASITSIKLASDDLDSDGSPALAFNVGLHDTDGTVVDADAYASAITLGQAATVFTEYAFEARNINACGQQLWADAGASVDPKKLYYVSMTVSTAAATAAAGDISFQIEYVVN